MKERDLDFLLRKDKGGRELPNYMGLFVRSGFSESELTYIELKESDNNLNSITKIFGTIDSESEMVSEKGSFNDSRSLSAIFQSDRYSTECYIFSDEVAYCGMFQVKTKNALEKCLAVAKLSMQNTCFLVGLNFDFSFTIDCNGAEPINHKNMFDIQRKIVVF